MLRRVSLQVTAENQLQSAAKEHGVKLDVVDCKPFNGTGMTLLLEMAGDVQKIRAAVAAIRRIAGVRQAVEGEDDGGVVPLLVVLDRPAICRVLNESAVICLECPLNSESQPASWRFLARKGSDLRQILAGLKREGVEAQIEDISVLEPRSLLTARQKEIMAAALSHGFFEFPRRVSLTQLSELLGVQPSTLSEILRGAERRIMKNALGEPFEGY